MMMVHMRLFWICDDANRTELKFEFPCPPVFLGGKTAKTLLAGILRRLPLPLVELKRKANTMTVMPLSDSARACKKMGRHFAACTAMDRVARNPGSPATLDGVVSLHPWCLMHMVGIIVGNVMTQLELLSPMFCACVLMSNAISRKSVVKEATELVRSSVRIVYARPENLRVEKFLTELFKQMAWFDSEVSEAIVQRGAADEASVRKQKAARLEARRRLARNLAASLFENGELVEWRCYAGLGSPFASADEASAPAAESRRAWCE